jgi:branched-chain amino acid transport system substrate-binding protein
MKKGTWGIVGIIIVVIIIIVAVSGSHSSNTQTGPLKIGYIGPLTGPAAPYGEPAANAMKIAVAEVNANGGINGRNIEGIYEDGKCSGTDAVTAVQKLINVDHVSYIIGGGCSGESFGIVPIITADKVVAISPISSAPKLSGASEYFLRNNPNDNAFVPPLATYMNKLGYKKVAVMAEQTDFAQGVKPVFMAEAQKNGQTVTDTEDFTSNTTDFRSILSKIKQTNPDAIFLATQGGATLVRIEEQARALGMKAVFTNLYLGLDPAIAESAKSLEGTIFADTPGLSGDAGKAFMTKYTSAYKTAPTYPLFAGAAYDGVYLYAQAIKAAGDDTTKVAQYLRSMSPYTGTIGTYSFDSNGDVSGFQPQFHKVVGGKVVEIQ